MQKQQKRRKKEKKKEEEEEEEMEMQAQPRPQRDPSLSDEHIFFSDEHIFSGIVVVVVVFFVLFLDVNRVLETRFPGICYVEKVPH